MAPNTATTAATLNDSQLAVELSSWFLG